MGVMKRCWWSHESGLKEEREEEEEREGTPSRHCMSRGENGEREQKGKEDNFESGSGKAGGIGRESEERISDSWG
jgi:hypothetical protein